MCSWPIFFFLIRWIWMIVDWKNIHERKILALFDALSFIVFSFNNHPNSSDFCFQLRKNRSGAHCLLKLASDNFNFLHALFSKIIPNSWRTVIHWLYLQNSTISFEHVDFWTKMFFSQYVDLKPKITIIEIPQPKWH